MLLELKIRNIALIESLRIEFAQGFNVLTGETGAGKSIVVDSVNLALGGRADRELIRTGEEKGSVEALFDVTGNDELLEMCEQLGVDADYGLISVSRELSRSGRNVCRIAGTVLPLSTLKQFTQLLVDVHGQHEHQSLMNPKKHMEFLDSFGDEAHLGLIEAVRSAHAQRAATTTQLRALLKDAAERERTIDMLRFQLEEITSAKLKLGEEETLEKKRKILENCARIQEKLDDAFAYAAKPEKAGNAQDALLGAANALQLIAGYDARYARLEKELRSLYYSVQDAGRELSELLDEIAQGYEPQELDRICSRLDLISTLERKYGATDAEVIAYGEAAATRLASIEDGDRQITELKKLHKAQTAALREACERLTQSRRTLATELETGIVRQLADLGMGRTRFCVELRPLEKPTAEGAEEIEFLIAANPGEPLKPLASTASGGELSRIMLAIKSLALGRGGVDTMVFDEIDTGVSGRMAQVVGEKMRAIASSKQVLCVTHLPQIAALGNTHFIVEKEVAGDRTHTNVRKLDEEGRVYELSRLVGSAQDSESSLAHARHMLEDAQSRA